MNSRYIQTIASTIHAAYIATTSGLYLCGYDIDYSYSLRWSMMYFVVDMAYLSVSAMSVSAMSVSSSSVSAMTSLDTQIMIHHVSGIAALLPNFFAPSPIYYYMAAVGFMSEISTVPLNICWYLHDTRQTNSILYKPMGFATLMLYVPFRLIGFPYVFVLLVNNGYRILSAFCSAVIALNYIWFFKLLKRAIN